MAQQVNGHVYLQTSEYDTFEHWKQFLLTHAVNFDYSFGNQCYDICALLYYQYGLTFYLGELEYAYEAWTVSKSRNAKSPFIGIDNINDVKAGDLLVFGRGWSAYGHVTFATEDYNGSGYIWTVGQNQGGGISWGSPSTPHRFSVGLFLGAFRNTKWSTPPQPIMARRKKGFPWFLIDWKRRNNVV